MSEFVREACSHEPATLAKPWDETHDWYEYWAGKPHGGLSLMLVIGRLEPHSGEEERGTWCGWVEPRCSACGAWNTYAQNFPVICSTCRFLDEPWVPLGSSAPWISPKRPLAEAERLVGMVENNPLQAVIMASDLVSHARKFFWSRVRELDLKGHRTLTPTV